MTLKKYYGDLSELSRHLGSNEERRNEKGHPFLRIWIARKFLAD